MLEILSDIIKWSEFIMNKITKKCNMGEYEMSINYYNNNAEKFIENTFNLSVEELINDFISFLPEKATVLDLGCGSGRDSLYFKEKGFDIHAMDGSKEMVAHTQKYIGEKVQLATFESYETNIKFDGIWALASLLHVPRIDISRTIEKYVDFLEVGGVFFMSFKNREFDYDKDGREFTCFTENELIKMLNEIEKIYLVKTIHTLDVRKDRPDEKWISVIVKRKG